MLATCLPVLTILRFVVAVKSENLIVQIAFMIAGFANVICVAKELVPPLAKTDMCFVFRTSTNVVTFVLHAEEGGAVIAFLAFAKGVK